MTRKSLSLALILALVFTSAGVANAQALSVLRPGSKGAEVERLQRALATLGYPVKADGVFGPKTSTVVRKVQAASGLKQDGLVGRSTWNAISWSLQLQQMIKQGVYIVQKGDTVASIAARLKVTEKSLIEANSLVTNRSLFAGQALSIPSKAQTTRPVERQPTEPVLAIPSRRVALTFDDVPGAGGLKDILQLLDARGVKATFFLTRDTLLRYREDLALASRTGHMIENHGDVITSTSGVSAIAADIRAVADTVEQVSGRRSAYFRPLSASVQAPVAEAAAASQHQLVMWSNVGKPDDDLLLKSAQDALFDGAVLRFSLNDPVVLEILPQLLEYMATHGYGAGPLSPSS